MNQPKNSTNDFANSKGKATANNICAHSFFMLSKWKFLANSS
jgi:hypothetical protein